ncbi:acylphosphatase [Lachnospiraceae bacterium]|nr:acylphosphatase [Lachnospiraceae bacterium]
MELKREHVVFTGRVQGVGFRYKAGRLARHYGVSGWIKNLADGSVEAQLQGREEALDLVIQGLNQDGYIRIDWITRNPMEPEAGEQGFSVRY